MKPAGLVIYGIIILVVGAFAGWHARTVSGANADLKVHKARIPGFRRARRKHGLVVVLIVIITLLVIKAVAS